jgi:O-phosphoseryl-tRNA(Cys) synthetase
MNEVIELLKEIKNKLDRIDERLSRIEEELFDEFSEDELEEIKRDIEAYEKGELETITLEELKKELEIDDEL